MAALRRLLQIYRRSPTQSSPQRVHHFATRLLHVRRPHSRRDRLGVQATGETFAQYAIESLSASDSLPISTPKNLTLLQSLAIAGQCQGFDISWSRKCTQTLLYPSRLLPREDLHKVSQFFIGTCVCRLQSESMLPSNLTIHNRYQPRPRWHGIEILLPPPRPVSGSRCPCHGHHHLDYHSINDLGMGFAWSKVTSYFSTLPAELKVQSTIVVIGCVSDANNRFKVYVRTQAAHLFALCDMLALGGRLKGPAIDAIASFRDIWHAVFGPISDETPVKHKRSNTGPTGFLFYYEMAISSFYPIPKTCIPAARLLKSDAHVTRLISHLVGSSYCKDVLSLL